MRVQTWIRTHKAHKSLYVHKSLVSFQSPLFLPLHINPKYKRVLKRTMNFVQSAFFVVVYVWSRLDNLYFPLSPFLLSYVKRTFYFPCVCLSTQNSQSSFEKYNFLPFILSRSVLLFLIVYSTHLWCQCVFSTQTKQTK